jgi:hypothetical protein
MRGELGSNNCPVEEVAIQQPLTCHPEPGPPDNICKIKIKGLRISLDISNRSLLRRNDKRMGGVIVALLKN